jgi:excisionase family DNA binding protein
MEGRQLITVAQAATKLRVSQSTIRNWIAQGRIQGEVGKQPRRPRWAVVADVSGVPLDINNRPMDIDRRSGSGEDIQIALLEARLSSIEQVMSRTSTGDERFRDAALQLNTAMEHQRRALQLQLEATKALDEAVAEQAAIIAGLLIGEPTRRLLIGEES